MTRTRMLWLGGLAVVAVAAATVAVRTASFAPADIADGGDVTLAPAPSYDLDAAVGHLSAATQIRTISHQDPADNDMAEWDRLHAWLSATYPAAPSARSEERREGKEWGSTCRSRWPSDHLKQKTPKEQKK